MTFEEFYKNTYRYVYVFFYSHVHDKSLIDDLCQEVYMNFYRKFYKDEHLGTDHIKLLFGFSRNIYKKHVQNSLKLQTITYVDDINYNNLLQDSPESEEFDNLKKEIQKLKIIAAMQKLNIRVREVLEYKYFYLMTRSEIAAIMEMKERDVLKYQQRGIRYLKKMLS